MVKWHDIDQSVDRDAWLDMRCGKVGGSEIGKIMANYGKAFGPPAHDVALRVAIEQITGIRQESVFSSVHTERGIEQEPIARALYEREFFCTVQNGGYYDSGDILGSSPDGLVRDDGQIEIKSVVQTIHYASVKRQSYDPSYKWQLFQALMLSGRKWLDFVSFCADFPQGKKLYTFRIFYKDLEDEFKMISSRVDDFKRLIDEKRKDIENM
jgi:hypothetical protein